MFQKNIQNDKKTKIKTENKNYTKNQQNYRTQKINVFFRHAV